MLAAPVSGVGDGGSGGGRRLPGSAHSGRQRDRPRLVRRRATAAAGQQLYAEHWTRFRSLCCAHDVRLLVQVFFISASCNRRLHRVARRVRLPHRPLLDAALHCVPAARRELGARQRRVQPLVRAASMV